MTVRWNNEFNPNELLGKITAIKITDSNGNIGFQTFPYREYLAVLESMLDFEIEIPEWDRSRFIRDAVRSIAQKGSLNPKNLLIEINKATKHFLSLPTNKYVLVSSLSITQTGNLLSKYRINENLIVPNPSFNKKHLAGIRHLQELVKINIDSKPPTNYMSIKINVSGRTPYEAFNNGIETLDLLRGIWNLGFNRSQYIRISFNTGEPVNKIRTGLIHSLHFMNGDLATDAGWFDSGFKLAKPFDITQYATQLNNSVANTLVKLKASSYRRELEDAIILYTRALDLQDWNSAFLKLWSLLEKLTDTEGSYSTTIKRTSFVFQDREYYRQVLKHLKDYRNKFVHDAFSSDEVETYMYQLKECAEVLLAFHIGNPFGFKSIKETAEFLDLPTDKKTLNQQITIRKHAQKYLRHIKG